MPASSRRAHTPQGSPLWSRLDTSSSAGAAPPVAPEPRFDFARIPIMPALVQRKAAVDSPGDPASGAAIVQRKVDFGSMYKGKDGEVRSRQGKGDGTKDLMTHDEFKATLGKTAASSESGGHRLAFPITKDELLEIFDGVAKDLQAKTVDDKTIDLYVEKLKQAFRVLKLDTVEVQASFLANAYSESDQFRYMTETEKATKSATPYQSDPSKVSINKSWLDCAAAVSAEKKKKGPPASEECKKQAGNVIDYEAGGSINPESDWQKSFIGRGPIQATHRHFYVQALAVLEKRAEELAAEDPSSKDLTDLREAIDKIKTDPREAANPKYAFLFSAGFMKMPDVSGVRGDVKATQGQVTSWMGQQPAEAKKRKDKAYAKAHKVLMDRWNVEQEIAKMLAGPAASEVADPGSMKKTEEALDKVAQ